MQTAVFFVIGSVRMFGKPFISIWREAMSCNSFFFSIVVTITVTNTAFARHFVTQCELNGFCAHPKKCYDLTLLIIRGIRTENSRNSP